MPVRRNKALSVAFTLVELLTVIAIIIILAGLILGTAGYVQRKGATSRASAEIAALSAACENYKADNGIYPRDTPVTGTTDTLNANPTTSPAHYDPTQPVYKNASNFLYNQLSPASGKIYFEFKPTMLSANPPVAASTYIVDPFGSSYGYSTANQGTATKGYNPTFDLWSTAGTTTAASSAAQAKWITNW